jgi:hypothetical protein
VCSTGPAQLEQVGGIAYISALLDMVPDVANVERYAAIVVLGQLLLERCDAWRSKGATSRSSEQCCSASAGNSSG